MVADRRLPRKRGTCSKWLRWRGSRFRRSVLLAKGPHVNAPSSLGLLRNERLFGRPGRESTTSRGESRPDRRNLVERLALHTRYERHRRLA